MDGGKTLSSNCSLFCCSSSSSSIAQSFCPLKYRRAEKVIPATVPRFITKNVALSHTGRMLGRSTLTSNTPPIASTPTKATNHHRACLRSANSRAPNGDNHDHRMTPLPWTNPPRAICKANGSAKMRSNWLNRKKRNLRVIAKRTMLTDENPAYVSGARAAVDSPAIK